MVDRSADITKILEKDFAKVNPSWLVPDIPLGFDLYIYLPQNRKLINYLKKEDSITGDKLDIFIRNKIATFYCPNEQKEEFYKFVENVKLKLTSQKIEIPSGPALMESAKKSSSYEMEMLRTKSEDVLNSMNVLNMYYKKDNEDVIRIKDVTQKIVEEIIRVKDSLSRMDEQEIFRIRNVTYKIRDEIQHVKRLHSGDKALNEITDKLSEEISYYIELINSIISSPDINDREYLQKELLIIGNKLKALAAKTGNADCIADTSLLTQHIGELQKKFSEFRVEDIEETHQLINSAQQSSADIFNNKDLDFGFRESAYVLNNYLESINKIYGYELSREQDYLQVLLETLHYSARLREHVEFENPGGVESDYIIRLLQEIKAMMMKVQEMVINPADNSVEIMDSSEWEIHNKIAELSNIRDKTGDITLRNLISKNIVFVHAFLKRARKELLSILNRGMETMVMTEVSKRGDETFEEARIAEHTKKALKLLLVDEANLRRGGRPEADQVSNGDVYDKNAIDKVLDEKQFELEKLMHEIEMLRNGEENINFTESGSNGGEAPGDNTIIDAVDIEEDLGDVVESGAVDEKETKEDSADKVNSEQYNVLVKDYEEIKRLLESEQKTNKKLSFLNEELEKDIEALKSRNKTGQEAEKSAMENTAEKTEQAPKPEENTEPEEKRVNLEEINSRYSQQLKTNELKRRSLEVDNSELKKQIQKLQDKAAEDRKKLSETVAKLRVEEMEHKKSLRKIESLEFQLKTINDEKDLILKRAGKQDNSALNQKMRQYENQIEKSKEMYKKLYKEYGMLTQQLADEKNKNKKLSIVNNELEQTVQDTKTTQETRTTQEAAEQDPANGQFDKKAA